MAYFNRTFVAAIRDTSEHESSTATDETGITVEDNELHADSGSNEFPSAARLRVYVESTHDQGFDVEIQHTSLMDDDFSVTTVAGTVALAADGDGDSIRIDGPIGNLQAVTLTDTLTTAPTTGELWITVLAVS